VPAQTALHSQIREAVKKRPELLQGRPMSDKSIPEWVNDTPADHGYNLTMFEDNDIGVEEIDLTRDEYLELKRHLAVMRGYIAPQFDPKHVPADLVPLCQTEWELIEAAHRSLEVVNNGKAGDVD
jgi:hypothetical protein